MSNILKVSAETFTRNDQIITLEKDGEEPRQFLLVNKANTHTQTAFLCVPIVPATDEMIEEIKSHNRFAPYGETLSKLFIPKCDQTGLRNSGVDYEDSASFKYHVVDFTNPVVLIDGTKGKQELDGKITKSVQASGLFAAMAKRMTTKMMLAGLPLINAYTKAYAPSMLTGGGATFDYGGILGTYGFDQKHGRFADARKHRQANQNIRRYGATNAPVTASTPAAE